MRLYLDSMVWIYAFEANSEFASPARDFFAQIETHGHTILVSYFLLAELLVLPVRRRDEFTVARYRHMLLDSAATEVIPFGTSTAMHFASLRAARKVKSPDALHLALAASASADAFITTDHQLTLLDVAGIGAVGDLAFSLL